MTRLSEVTFHQLFHCRVSPQANASKFSTVEASVLQAYAVLLLEAPFLRSAGPSLIKHT